MDKQGFASLCARDVVHGSPSHILPIHQTSTFIYPSPEVAMKYFKGESEEEVYIYSRWGNPTVNAVEEKIAALECFDLKDSAGNNLKAKALMFSSGMGAISAVLLSNLKAGDAVITSGNIYGTSMELMQTILPDYGIEMILCDLKNMNELEEKIKSNPKVKMIYIETPSNPNTDCYDLSAISSVAKKHKLKTAVDNTIASPFLQQPFKYGIDFIVHSTTKFLNGHGTAISGLMVGIDSEFMKKRAWTIRKTIGASANPMDAWLLNNGIKTLPLRMVQHSNNAYEVAKFLESNSSVAKVFYIGLKSHPDHLLANTQMNDSGGVLSFELKGGLDAGIKLMQRVKFCHLTSTLGTIDTLINHPASMTHVQVLKEQREKSGITDGLIRMSIGIENVEDIIADLDQALKG